MEVEIYALAAMQALISSGLNTDAWDNYEDLAQSAFAIADAMKKVEEDRKKIEDENDSKALDEALANPIIYP
ncbi:hypothetical protein [Pantoea sp. BAV 3049]|uniref:hypothetical protein n=1 Tax=Pantoea sp. BAV 3049 TaxID=2654188 RepID=UPI00131B5BC1|nr:hypothetical protein [Pantoea sp. BAV 3049]